MPSNLTIKVDLHQLLELGPVVRAAAFANLAEAVENVAQAGAERWREAVQAAPLWSGERDAYADTIRYEMKGQFAAEIVSDYKYVEDIERGRSPYDMKKMLNTSLKVRVSKTGRRYLIIPFRHNLSDMPSAVQAKAKALKPSRITGTGSRVSGTGAWDTSTRAPLRVPTRKYVWGGRLSKEQGPRVMPLHGPGVRQTSKTGRHDGMVRMDTSSGRAKSSAYLTFRVMAEGQSGWIIPARPGLWIARAVAASIERTAATDIGEAIARDLAA